MSVYRLSSPYERPPLRRRTIGLALALAVNLLLLLALLTLGKFAPEVKKVGQALVVDLVPQSRKQQTATHQPISRPTVKPPPVVLPVKPTIIPPPQKPLPILKMSKQDMAAGDIGNLPKSAADGSATADSEVVGRGPHGEVLYAAEWARRPTDTEKTGYLPHNPQDGFGLIACKTVPDDRVDDCVELAETPGSHLASAVRQAAWQFRVRPPRKNGVPLVGSWVSIRIDYTFTGSGG